MKTTIVIVLACVCTSSFSHAQGTVNFANAGAGINAPVHIDTIGGTLAGAGYMAQLFLVEGGGSLTPVGNVATFVGAAAPGYFNGGVVTVNQVAPGVSATFQAFGWDSSLGATTYPAALAAWNGGLIHGGYSAQATVVTGGAGTPASPPAALPALQPWILVIVPEPSTALLALLGAGALLIRRRY